MASERVKIKQLSTSNNKGKIALGSVNQSKKP